MARVTVEVEETTLIGSDGRDVDGVNATCSRCNHSVEVFGTGEGSVRRGCVMLREECPEKEHNFYVPE
jgi:hypothetical protein